MLLRSPLLPHLLPFLGPYLLIRDDDDEDNDDDEDDEEEEKEEEDDDEEEEEEEEQQVRRSAGAAAPAQTQKLAGAWPTDPHLLPTASPPTCQPPSNSHTTAPTSWVVPPH